MCGYEKVQKDTSVKKSPGIKYFSPGFAKV